MSGPTPGPTLQAWLDAQRARPDWPTLRTLIGSLVDLLDESHAGHGAIGGIAPYTLILRAGRIVAVVAGVDGRTGSKTDQEYRAAELAVDGATRQGDLYALAAVAFRICTGQAPDRSPPGEARPLLARAAHLAADDYPAAFLDVIDAALSAPPDRRPGLQDWRAALACEMLADADRRTVGGPEAAAPGTGAATGRRLLWGLTGSALAASAAGVWLVTQFGALLTAKPVGSPSVMVADAKAVEAVAPAAAAKATEGPPDERLPPATQPPKFAGGASAPVEVAPPTPRMSPPAQKETKPQPLTSPFRDCETCPQMVVIAPGTVRMQLSLPGKPAPLVYTETLPRAFAAGRFELTRGEFRAFVEATGYVPAPGCHVRRPEWKLDATLSWRSPGFAQDDRHPVTCLSFTDAKAYVTWLGQRTGRSYRLLTDTEWHWLASGAVPPAAEQCKHANGADRTARRVEAKWAAADCDDGYHYTAPAGSFAAASNGLSDVFGNVWEWVDSCAPDTRQQQPVFGSCAESAPRILRGGSWGSDPAMMALDARILVQPDVRDHTVGVRIARDLSTCEATGEGCPATPPAAEPPPVSATAPPAAQPVANSAGFAEQVMGKVLAVGHQERKLDASSPVYVGELVHTDAGARATLKLGKRTTLRLGERTDVKLERYLVDAGGDIDLRGGAIQFERTGPPADTTLTIRSAYGMIAVRGTRFFAGPSRGKFGVLVGSGQVAVTSGGQTVIVGPQMGTDIEAPGAPPSAPTEWPYERVREALDSVR